MYPSSKKNICEVDKQIIDKITIYKNNKINKYNDLILENADLFSVTNDDLVETIYYSCLFSKPKERLFTFTVNSELSFYRLACLIHPKLSNIYFFNIKNFIICDISDDVMRNKILNMFCTSQTVVVDFTTPIKSLIKESKLDIIFFINKEFYKIKIKNILKVHRNIADYFRYTNVKIEDVKCHLCCKNNWEIILDKNFVLTEKFYKFCKTCLEIIRKIPLI